MSKWEGIMAKDCDTCKYIDTLLRVEPCSSCDGSGDNYTNWVSSKPQCPDCAEKDAEILSLRLQLANEQKKDNTIETQAYDIKIRDESIGKLDKEVKELKAKLYSASELNEQFRTSQADYNAVCMKLAAETKRAELAESVLEKTTERADVAERAFRLLCDEVKHESEASDVET
jgi:hypothetical protein